MPPSGDTASRPQSCAAGTLRFNTDAGTLEVYRGDTIGWEFIEKRDNQYLGGGTGSPPSHLSLAGTRAVILGGTGSSGSSLTDNIDFFTIQTQGNADTNLSSSDFGDVDFSTLYGGSSTTYWPDTNSISDITLNSTAISAFSTGYLKLAVMWYDDYNNQAPLLVQTLNGYQNFSYVPRLEFTATATGYSNNVIGVDGDDIDNIISVDAADIDNVAGI